MRELDCCHNCDISDAQGNGDTHTHTCTHTHALAHAHSPQVQQMESSGEAQELQARIWNPHLLEAPSRAPAAAAASSSVGTTGVRSQRASQDRVPPIPG